MSRTSIMYCCDRCTFAQYHPMNYCPKCPGRLIAREVPHPSYRFALEEQQVTWLEEQGINYIGECYEFPPDDADQLRLSRWREQLADAEQHGHKRRIKFWKDRIAKEFPDAS